MPVEHRGQYEFLFSTFGDCPADRGCRVTSGTNAGIHIFLGCDNDRQSPSSTVDTSSEEHAVNTTACKRLLSLGCVAHTDGAVCSRSCASS